MRWRLVAAAAIAVAAYRPALAADLPIPSYPPPLPVAVYNWTGVYLGINGGFDTGSSKWSDGPIVEQPAASPPPVFLSAVRLESTTK